MKRVIPFLLVTVPAALSAEMYGAEYQACNQSTTADIVRCVNQAAQKWDKKLNTAYKALMERSEPQQNDALRKAQRLWIQYRDANCAFYAANSGSIGRIEAAECIRVMTKSRTCEMDLANQGDSQPLAECSRPTSADTSQASASASPSFQPAASTPAASPSATSTFAASTPEASAGGVLPITMASTLEGLSRQYGASFIAMPSAARHSRGKPRGSIHANVHFEQEVLTAGGSAIFGWMEDTGQVVLMTHAKYLPSLTLAATSRHIEFTHALESVAQAPRYLMTCIWQREDDQLAPAMRLYAERDDANSRADVEKEWKSVLVSWVGVPAARAEKRFAANDYCTEVATRETSSAPFWEDALHR